PPLLSTLSLHDALPICGSWFLSVGGCSRAKGLANTPSTVGARARYITQREGHTEFLEEGSMFWASSLVGGGSAFAAVTMVRPAAVVATEPPALFLGTGGCRTELHRHIHEELLPLTRE